MTDRASFWHLRRFVDKLPGGILCNKTLSLGENRTYGICIHYLVGNYCSIFLFKKVMIVLKNRFII